MLIEKLWRLWKQKRCRHHYKKRWSKEKKSYIMRCMKCGKEKEYEKKEEANRVNKMEKTLYKCNPELNKLCKKTICKYNANAIFPICESTSKKEFTLKDGEKAEIKEYESK